MRGANKPGWRKYSNTIGRVVLKDVLKQKMKQPNISFGNPVMASVVSSDFCPVVHDSIAGVCAMGFLMMPRTRSFPFSSDVSLVVTN